MKNTFKTLAFLFIGALTFNSCDSVGDDEELNYGQGAYVSQFSTDETTGYFLKDNDEVFPFNIPVELAGGNGLGLSSDLTLTYQVNTTLITAVEGTNYNFVNAVGTSVVPAGNKFASIKITVDSATLDETNPPVLVLDLVSATADGNTVVVSGNKNRITVILQGTCTSNLAGSYSVSTVRFTPVAGGPYLNTTEQIDETSPGNYDTTTVGNYKAPTDIVTGTNWANLLAAVDAGFAFKEVCGNVKVELQRLGKVYTNDVNQNATQYADSSVDEATGVITIYYSIYFSNNTEERKYRSIYTPN